MSITGLIVVDHGSKRAESNAMHEQLVGLVAQQVPYDIVEPAHMELAEPSIDTAFGRCVTAGADFVIISPYFLLPGRHWSVDIPTLARGAAARHPGVGHVVTAPLGLHPLMAQVVAARVAHCIAHLAGTTGPCDVCEHADGCRLHNGANTTPTPTP